VRVSDTKSANERVNRFARWLNIPSYNGKPWRLTTIKAEDLCTVCALRDRTALYALAQHLGTAMFADRRGLRGTDHNLEREMTRVLDSSPGVEQMLTAPTLGGWGAEVLARRRGFALKRQARDSPLRSHAGRDRVDAGSL